jgi:branched-chain amino acid transport system permease protein
VVLMTLLGGMGTVFGPVVGAATIVTLQNELADKVGSLVTVIMGAIFVICVLAFRRGIVGEEASSGGMPRASKPRRPNSRRAASTSSTTAAAAAS